MFSPDFGRRGRSQHAPRTNLTLLGAGLPNDRQSADEAHLAKSRSSNKVVTVVFRSMLPF